MAASPSQDETDRGPEAALQALVQLSRDLSGTLRPIDILHQLAQALERWFAPDVLGIGRFNVDSNRLDVVHAIPPETSWLHPALDLAMRREPELMRRAEDTLLTVPLESGSLVIGSVLLGAGPGRYHPHDLATLRAFVAIASLAMDAGRMIDQVEQSRQSWSETVDAVSLALCLVDGWGRILRANRAFADLVNAAPAGVISRPWMSLVPASWGEAVQQALDESGSGREIDLRAGDRSFAVTAFTTGSDQQQRVLVFLDRTERRRLQEQLIQSEKMSAVGQLVAGVAHDLNNPLASVLGFADFLVESPEVPASIREPIRVIQEESLRAATIVRNLLGFARKQEHRRQRAAMGPLLESTLTLLRNQLMADKIEVTLSVMGELPGPPINANQIQQVFVNLINNASQAIAATGRPGEIIITAHSEPACIIVEVTDTGPGMTESLAARVFEPFFTTKPEGQGTGLGLSICQGIIKEHGGRITLRTAPGEGSTFRVELPLIPAPEEETPKEPGAPVEHRTFRILLIDDEPHIVHYLRTTLEAWGHVVESAVDGQAGLELASQGGFDLIISDLRMPRLGGQEFYEELMSKNPAIAQRVVFSTGDTLRGDTLKFLEREGRPYLSKPFSLTELRNLLVRMAGDRRAPSPAG
ncbi:MAG TPA: ATP-binding protein [Gemmatimonadales bacterium]|jgi:two-component system NtrC family sensor kinase|nr:ATP-binding protein [Gemmatimonadales bacterium]